jgi:hypothetical protein
VTTYDRHLRVTLCRETRPKKPQQGKESVAAWVTNPSTCRRRR